MIFHQPDNSQGNYNYNAYFYRGKSYAPHFHKNYELMFPLEGSFTATVNGVRYQVEAGQLLLVLSNQIHSFEIPEDASVWVGVFSGEYISYFDTRVKGMQGKTALFTVPETTFALLEKFIEDDSSVMMRTACFCAVCDGYLSAVPLESRQEKTDFPVGQLLDWLSLHYTEDISLKQAANMLGYEYHYLSRLLHHGYDISFSKLLNGYRLEHALRLLRSTDLSMGTIADYSGFQSIRTFNLAVKSHTGMSPNAWRSIDKTGDLG